MISYRRLLFICGALLFYAYSGKNNRFDYQYAETPPESFNADLCANLNFGEICTFAGNPDLGNKIDPTLNRKSLKFGPSAHASDSTGFFIADRAHGVVWYWNRSSSTVSRLGISVDSRKIRVVAGSGGSKIVSTTMAQQTQFDEISALAFDDSKQRLYIAEPQNHRVRFIDKNGLVFSGLGNNSNRSESHLAIDQTCHNPVSLILSSSRSFVYVACKTDNLIKAWDTGSGTAVNLVDVQNPIALAMADKRLFVSTSTQNQILEVINGRTQKFYQHQQANESLTTFAADNQSLWITTSDNRLFAIDLATKHSRLVGRLPATFLTADPQNPGQLIFSQKQGHFGFFSVANQTITQSIGSGGFRYGFDGDQTLPRNLQKLSFVTGLAFHPKANELMVMDSGNCRVRRVVDDTMETAVARGCGSPTIENQNPLSSFLDTFSTKNGVSLAGISFLPDQSLLIANTGANSIRLWNRSSSENSAAGPIERDKIKTFAGDFLTRGNDVDGKKATESRLNRPTYAIQDPLSKKILIADSANGCLKQLHEDGTLSVAFGKCGIKGTVTSPTTMPLFEMPTSMAFDSFGNLIVADRGSQSLIFINRNSTAVQVAGLTVAPGQAAKIACRENGDMGEDVLAFNAECAAPTGLAIHDDKVCFSNQLSHNVRCFDLYGPRAGQISTVAGQPQIVARAGTPFGLEQEGVFGTEATLAFPSALTFDKKGDLYIADTYNHLVRKLKLSK